MSRLHETAITRLHVSDILFIFLKREAETCSFLDYYNTVLCVNVMTYEIHSTSSRTACQISILMPNDKENAFHLAFMGPCIVRIFECISNKMQLYTVYFTWKLLYMFRVIPPPISRSANNCIYSIWYLSDRYCYLPV